MIIRTGKRRKGRKRKQEKATANNWTCEHARCLQKRRLRFTCALQPLVRASWNCCHKAVCSSCTFAISTSLVDCAEL